MENAREPGNRPRRAALYIRVSTKEQAEKGWSVEGQEKDIRAWMELTHPNWKLVKLIRDRRFSTSTTERPALQTMPALAAQGALIP